MRNLFRPPAADMAADLDRAMQAIADATRMNATHARELPYAVRDLSRLLTQERSRIASSYWINKRLLSAYCRYFLPWNLLRLAWTLPGLGLTVKPGDTIVDLGSGPLTLPLALWIAYPQWREMPLTIICGDIAPAPLAAGKEIFTNLAGNSPWKIVTKRGPLDAVLRALPAKAALITACNVLNEGREGKAGRETPFEDRLGSVAALAASRLTPEGRFLAVEPGTRLGGKLMAGLRHAAFAAHLVPDAPCTHWDSCPMRRERATGPEAGSGGSGWCHFSHTVGTVPAALAQLTKKAKLEKENVSLSCMLLRHASEEELEAARALLPEYEEPESGDYWDDDDDDDYEDNVSARDLRDAWATAFAASRRERDDAAKSAFVRVLSDPIRIPDAPEPARYGCSAKGLVLVHNALRMPSGAALEIRWPEEERRDGKSGAIILTLKPTSGAAPTPGNAPASPRKPAQQERRPDQERTGRPAKRPRNHTETPEGRRDSRPGSSPGSARGTKRNGESGARRSGVKKSGRE